MTTTWLTSNRLFSIASSGIVEIPFGSSRVSIFFPVVGLYHSISIKSTFLLSTSSNLLAWIYRTKGYDNLANHLIGQVHFTSSSSCQILEHFFVFFEIYSILTFMNFSLWHLIWSTIATLILSHIWAKYLQDNTPRGYWFWFTILNIVFGLMFM